MNLLDFPRVRELMHLDPPEPVLDVAPGDEVIAHGRNGVLYRGLVLATDPWQQLALVLTEDPYAVRGEIKLWWEVTALTATVAAISA